eukprot:scaffold10560_cov133-Isochrysis_galbana.AAC.3
MSPPPHGQTIDGHFRRIFALHTGRLQSSAGSGFRCCSLLADPDPRSGPISRANGDGERKRFGGATRALAGDSLPGNIGVWTSPSAFFRALDSGNLRVARTSRAAGGELGLQSAAGTASAPLTPTRRMSEYKKKTCKTLKCPACRVH